MAYIVPGISFGKCTAHNQNKKSCFGNGKLVIIFFPSLVREGKWSIENEPKYQTVVHITDREYVCSKHALATSDVIDFQAVKHAAFVFVTG